MCSRKDWSRKDPMKVAQYEVLGNVQKEETRPERDDRRVLALREPRWSDPEPKLTSLHRSQILRDF
jgi:hypothetical protein